MSTLINQLKLEHQDISLILTEVNKLGVFTHGGQLKLEIVKKMFFKHLQKENEELYPILNLEAKNNKILKNNMQALSLEMKSIIENTAKFFQKYEGVTNNLEFSLDFGNLFSMLVQRFVKEEKVLYSEYIRIKSSVKSIL